MVQEKRIRVLIAKLGADVHWRGAYVVTRMLRDAGMEVVYIDNAMPDGIVKAAIQECPDVVGVSTLIGNHVTTGGELMELARKKGLTEDTLFLIGGVFPSYDVPKLKELGFDGVFVAGATQDEIVSFIKTNIKSA
jgi:methylmalonyl-CoA mutase C-terminal domain/subunit